MARARFIALLLLTIVGFVAGCGKEQAPVDRVGTNAVAKSFFQDSSWYFGRTVIDVDYELVEGANPGTPEPGSLLGQPIAAFEIEKHFDVRRAYTDSTGEELNIIEENDTDRPWYERDHEVLSERDKTKQLTMQRRKKEYRATRAA